MSWPKVCPKEILAQGVRGSSHLFSLTVDFAERNLAAEKISGFLLSHLVGTN